MIYYVSKVGKDLHIFETVEKLVLFPLSKGTAPKHPAGGNVSVFGKACGFIPLGVIPLVKALLGYVPAVLTA